MREILLPFGPQGPGTAAVKAAFALAKRHRSTVHAAFYPRVPAPMIVDPMSPGVISYDGAAEDVAAQRAEAQAALERELTALSKSTGDDDVRLDLDGLGSWHKLAELSRVFDVTVLTRTAESGDWQMMFESVLFEGGRPVMLVPEDWSGDLGARVGVAWNRSTETARLVGQTMDVLRAADHVNIVEVEGFHISGPDGSALKRYVAGHDVPVELITAAADSGGPGRSFLAQAKAANTDLLLKGAYTQSRLTQMIFGGATKQILEEASIPVIFAH
jgi:nucleotide-binding universal stress UspA family protein